MTHISRMAFIFSLCAPLLSVAETNYCETDKYFEMDSDTHFCQCGSSLKELNIKKLPGLKLITVCDLTDQGSPYPSYKPQKIIDLRISKEISRIKIGYGTFYYKGAMTLSGTLEKGDMPNEGDFYFHPDQPNSMRSAIGMNREDRRLGAAKLSARWDEPHWCAKATIKFTKVKFSNYDTGYGLSALTYEVLKIGKYERCGHP